MQRRIRFWHPLLAAAALPIVVVALSRPAGAQVDVALGELPSGGTITVEIVVTVPAPAAAGIDVFSTQGTVSGDNFATVDTDDPDGAGATDPTLTNLLAQPDLTMAKSDGGATGTPGGTVAYSLTFANNGNQGATGVTISETVPTHATFNAGDSSPGWSCADGSPAGTPCTLVVGGVAGGGGGGAATFAVAVVPGGKDTTKSSKSGISIRATSPWRAMTRLASACMSRNRA